MAAKYVTKIRTVDGDLPIDYNALANLPVLPNFSEEGLIDYNDLANKPDLSIEGLGAAPADHTHTIEDLEAASVDHTHTAAEIGAAPAYTYGTEDLEAGVSELTTGTLYFVYE